MAHIWNPSSQEAGNEDWKCEASLGYISSPCLRKPRAGLWFSGRAVLLACTGAWVVPREKEWILEVQTREARKIQERGKGGGSMSARMDPGLGRPVLRLISTPPLTTALHSVSAHSGSAVGNFIMRQYTCLPPQNHTWTLG